MATILLAAGLMTIHPGAARANTAVTLYVDSTQGTVVSGCTAPGSGACETIQQGVNAAESYSSSDVTVEVAAGTYNEHDTINVPSGDTLVVQGAGASSTTVDAGNSGSTILINAGTVTIAGLTITGGSAASGGGIYSGGTTTLTDDTIEGNAAFGGSNPFGGGIYIAAGTTATVENDTIANNVSGFNGGAAFIANTATATFANDTITGNIGDSFNNGVYNAGALSVVDDTFANNGTAQHAGPALENSGGTVTISDSILQESFDCYNSGGTLVDGGYNVESGNGCGFGSSDTVNSSTINLSSTLGANGSAGPPTLAIGTNSSAYKEVPTANCTVATDERGKPRPGIPGQYCDAGAFEYQQPLTPSTPTISNLPTSGTYGGGFTATVSTTGDGTKSVTSSTTAVCTASGTAVSYVGVGTCSLTAHVAAGTNYAAADGNAQSFPVGRATPSTPSITNLPSGGKVGGGFAATVSTNGDGAASVTSSTPSVCTASGLAVSYGGAGTCTLVAHVGQGTDYAAADGSAQSFSIQAAPKACVVPSVKGKTLDAAKQALVSADCGVGAVTHAFSRTVRKGRVISEKPSANARLAHGAKVSLVVSRGKR